MVEGGDARPDVVVERLLEGLERDGDRLFHFRTLALAEIFDTGHDDGFDVGREFAGAFTSRAPFGLGDAGFDAVEPFDQRSRIRRLASAGLSVAAAESGAEADSESGAGDGDSSNKKCPRNGRPRLSIRRLRVRRPRKREGHERTTSSRSRSPFLSATACWRVDARRAQAGNPPYEP